MASTKILEQKQQIVKELADKMQGAKSGVLVDFKGITVADDTKLRSEMRKIGVEYSVVKNTLTSKACDIIGFEQLKDVLSGMTAIAISNDDQIAPAKILCEYAKKNEKFIIKAGFVDSGVIDADAVKALAEIPSKEVLIAKVMGSLQSSLYSFAYALQAIIDKNSEGESASAEA
ncbi:MAG: 50S ribosomal protein L10 [Firmicutes bacterium HGW-Firmicutes-21]|nr:MAG: 50S ribosomal protein L10 [Firmicutes bacterium HGW-Firmicutes-21]